MERWVVVVGALLALGSLWWLTRRPRLRVSDRGILDRGSGLGWIRWDEIEGASPVRGSNSVLVRLRAESRAARRLRERTLELDLGQSGLSPVELLRTVVHRGVPRRRGDDAGASGAPLSETGGR